MTHDHHVGCIKSAARNVSANSVWIIVTRNIRVLYISSQFFKINHFFTVVRVSRLTYCFLKHYWDFLYRFGLLFSWFFCSHNSTMTISVFLYAPGFHYLVSIILGNWQTYVQHQLIMKVLHMLLSDRNFITTSRLQYRLGFLENQIEEYIKL